MTPLDFIKLFHHAYALVAHCVIENHYKKCKCRDLVKTSLQKFSNLLDELQLLPDLQYNTRTKWQQIISKARGKLADYCDDGRDVLLHCLERTHLTTSGTLNFHLLTFVTTVLSLKIIWKDEVNKCKNVHPEKSNMEILDYAKDIFLFLGNFEETVLDMMTIYPQHFVTLVLTWNEKEDDLEMMCGKALKFLRDIEGDALVDEDRLKIGEIIKSQIIRPHHIEGSGSYCFLSDCEDIDSEDSWSTQYSTESPDFSSDDDLELNI